MEKIEQSAIKLEQGCVLSLPSPARHHDIIAMAKKLGIDRRSVVRGGQGFVTDSGRFVDRYEAGQIAVAAGQVIMRGPNGQNLGKSESLNWPPQLYSEDVW